MADEVEVTERGEIVVRGCDGEAMAYQADGSWWLSAETYADGGRPSREGETRLTRDGLLSFCRRVLAEVDPDPAPTVDEAAIRADEAERIAAWMVSRTRLIASRQREEAGVIDVLTGAMLDAICEGVEEVAAAIRDGLHRSTP